jgi:hypothetical protein
MKLENKKSWPLVVASQEVANAVVGVLSVVRLSSHCEVVFLLNIMVPWLGPIFLKSNYCVLFYIPRVDKF